MDINGMFADIGLMAALCLVFGIILVTFEMFIPGFGIPGFFGVCLLVLGVTMTARTVVEGLFLVGILLAIFGIVLTIVFRSATKGKLGQSVILTDSLNKEAGFSGTEDLSCFLGKEGVTRSVLRPAGTAEFDGVKLDVVSEAEFIPQNSQVKVVKVEGRRIVVREVKPV